MLLLKIYTLLAAIASHTFFKLMFRGCREVGLHRERWNWTIWSIDDKPIYNCLLWFGISLCKFLPRRKHKSRSHKYKLQLIVRIEDTLATRRCPNVSRSTFAMETYIPTWVRTKSYWPWEKFWRKGWLWWSPFEDIIFIIANVDGDNVKDLQLCSPCLEKGGPKINWIKARQDIIGSSLQLRNSSSESESPRWLNQNQTRHTYSDPNFQSHDPVKIITAIKIARIHFR